MVKKPGHQSRGRGITILSKYNDILKYIRESRGRNWVIQKYIENPLIINRRKFDIRQWVLVTDWNPLTVWVYNQSYIRFAMMDYDPKNRAKFAHLTNKVKESIEPFQIEMEKLGEDTGFNSSDSDTSDDDEEPENIWSLDDFQDHI